MQPFSCQLPGKGAGWRLRLLRPEPRGLGNFRAVGRRVALTRRRLGGRGFSSRKLLSRTPSIIVVGVGLPDLKLLPLPCPSLQGAWLAQGCFAAGGTGLSVTLSVLLTRKGLRHEVQKLQVQSGTGNNPNIYSNPLVCFGTHLHAHAG